MATVFIHDDNLSGNTDSWIPIASSDAKGVFTKNTSLTGKPANESSNLEEVLLRDREDIETLKKNISWLALHGGGGYGPGSGGNSNYTVTVNVLDENRNPTNTIIWSDRMTSIMYKISSRGTSKYTSYIYKGGNLIQQNENLEKNKIYYISASVLKLTESTSLQIAVKDENGDEFITTCQILVSSIAISSKTNEIIVTKNELATENRSIVVSILTNISGPYDLYISRYGLTRDSSGEIWEGEVNLTRTGRKVDLGVLGTSLVNKEISINNATFADGTSLFDNNDNYGSYTVTIKVVHSTNLDLFSQNITVPVSIIETSGITIIPLVAQETSPLQVRTDGLINLQFKVISNSGSGTYSYKIFNSKNILVAEDSSRPFSIIMKPSLGAEAVYSGFTEEELDSPEATKLRIEAIGNGYSDSTYFYIQVIQTAISRLTEYLHQVTIDSNSTLDNNLIFDYTPDLADCPINSTTLNSSSSSFTFPQDKTVNANTNYSKEFRTKFYLKNRGTDTKLENRALNIRHRCYGMVTCLNSETGAEPAEGKCYWFVPDTSEANKARSMFHKDNAKFTIEIAFFIGKEDDNDATVFSLGLTDENNINNQNGILIKSHKYYIRFGETFLVGDVQVNSFNHLIITTRYRTGNWELVVFKNGLYDQISNSDAPFNPDNVFSNGVPSLNKAYIATNNGNDNYCNVQLYSIRMFSASFNLGQALCSYINNYVCFKLDQHGNKDPELFATLLTKNAINSDAKIRDERENGREIDISSLYSAKTGEFTLGLTTADITAAINRIQPYVKIPIVVLTANGWSYNYYRQTGKTSKDFTISTNNSFYYSDPLNQENILQTSGVSVSIQGTTTAGYTIKNLEIEFTGKTFSPKNTWFPESSFVLKADVVDSGHVNNAVIGKFINDIYNSSDIINPDVFPMKTVIAQENYRENLDNTLTAKCNIEGFPIFLIVQFNDTENNTSEIVPLGLYSFNLGRNSYHNLGFQIPKGLRVYDPTSDEPKEYSRPSETAFPGFYFPYREDDYDTTYHSYCYEGASSFDNSVEELNLTDEVSPYRPIIGYKVNLGRSVTNSRWVAFPSGSDTSNVNGYVYFKNNRLLNDAGNPVEWNNTNVRKIVVDTNGYFWSKDPSYAEAGFWDETFRSDNLDTTRIAFKILNNYIATSMEYEKGSLSVPYDTAYQSWKIEFDYDSEGNPINPQRLKVEGANNTTTATYGNVDNKLTLVSVRNTSFYYVMCLLFGLVDSLGKNLQMKSWRLRSSNSRESIWTPSFYDMDTALGLDNQGYESKIETILDYELNNSPGLRGIYEMYKYTTDENDSEKFYTVCGNKLWGAVESSTLVNKASTDFSGDFRFYSRMWNRIRTEIIPDVEKFIETYFYSQNDNCGQLLVNLDYETKYVNTREKHMLHGNRLDFIRNWLTDRIYFLDSLFDYKKISTGYLNGNINSYLVPTKSIISIFHNSGALSVPIETTSTVILRSDIGGKETNYFFAKKDTPIDLKIANSIGTSDITTTINNSRLIKKINNIPSIKPKTFLPNEVTPVITPTGTRVYQGYEDNVRYNYGNLSNLKVFDLHGVSSLTGNIDLFELFRAWNATGYGGQTEASRLEELNYSRVISAPGTVVNANLSGTNVGIEGIPDSYRNPFINLVKIDVSESNISSVTIPKNVSLSELNIKDSLIQKLELDSQPLLVTPNFYGCSNLSEVSLIGCDKFTSIKFNSTNVSLKNLLISNCPNVTTVEIIADKDYYQLPKITISDCPNLTTLTATGCISPEGASEVENADIITIIDCPSLSKINLSNSDYKTVRIESTEKILDEENNPIAFKYPPLENLTNLNLSDSKVGTIKCTRLDEITIAPNALDLENCKNLGTINCSNDKKFQRVLFKCDKLNPIVISTEGAFRNCTSLEAIKGNLILTASSIFAGCVRLSLKLGSKLGLSYDEKTHPVDLDPQETEVWNWESEEEEYIKWNDILNIRFAGEGATSAFSGTTVSSGSGYLYNFDIYYCLYNLVRSNTITVKIPGENDSFTEVPIITQNATVTNISNMFSSLATTNLDFGYSSNNNSLNKNTFINCKKVTAVSGLFYNTKLTNTSYPYLRIVSPTKNSDNTWNDDGLLSPLKNVTSFGTYWILYDKSFICDRNIFAGSTNFSKLTTLYFSPALIVEDINSATSSNYTSTIRLISSYGDNNYNISSTDEGKMGNINGIFKNCTALTTFMGFNSPNSYIKLGLINGTYYTPSFPTTLSSITNSFKCRARGTLKLDRLFSGEGNIMLSSIGGSFQFSSLRINGWNTYIDFELKENYTFENLPYLTSITKYTNISDPQDLNTSFRGNGLNKFIRCLAASNVEEVVTIPNILGNTNNWTVVRGLLREAKLVNSDGSDVDDTLKRASLPGDLFKNKQSLTNIVASFYNFKSNFEFTEGGFIGCNSLTDVRYLFYRENENPKKVKNCIPLEFFSTKNREDWDTTTITFKGTNWISDPIQVDEFRTENRIKVALISAITESTDDITGITIRETVETRYINYEIENEVERLIKISPITEKKVTTITITTTSEGTTSTSRDEGSYTQVGIASEETIKEDTIEYLIPPTKINEASYCFSGLGIPMFINNNSGGYTLENCKDYSPFSYEYSSEAIKHWSKNNKQYTKKKTYMWSFDGNLTKYLREIIDDEDSDLNLEELEWLDDIDLEEWRTTLNSIEEPQIVIKKNTGFGLNNGIQPSQNTENDIRYCLPPDIFRYFSSSANVTGIFSRCGSSYMSRTEIGNAYGDVNSTRNWFNGYWEDSNGYGLTGRICPYILKPVSNSNNLGGLFKDCKWIGYYSINGKLYMIPKTLFSYVTSDSVHMENMFNGSILPVGVDTDIFDFKKKEFIEVYLEGIFSNSVYFGGTQENYVIISSTFSNEKLQYQTLKEAFSVSSNINQNYRRDQYVRFDNIFNSTGKNIIAENLKIFYGYSQGYVQHENPKTASTAPKCKNYDYYNE